jgi:hypothetical protein
MEGEQPQLPPAARLTRGTIRLVRRLLRILITIAAVLSLLLCLTTAALWWRSARAADHVTYTWPIEDGQRVRLGTVGLFGNQGSPVLVVYQCTLIPANTAAALTSLRAEAASLPKFEHWEDRPGQPDVPVAGHDWQGFFAGSSDAAERFRITPNGPIYAAQSRYLTLAAPWWSLITLFAIGPTGVFLRWHRAHRRRLTPGHCPVCGYDLRASPERCPECGNVNPISPASSPNISAR